MSRRQGKPNGAASAEGPYQRITAGVIPGLGSSPEGARYTYRDPSVVNGIAYFYKLEDIEQNHEAYTGKGEVATGPAVKKLV